MTQQMKPRRGWNAWFLIVVASSFIVAGCSISGTAAIDISGVSIDTNGISVQSDGGNPFYYEECSGSISLISGVSAGCERKWKPLFYGCVVGGAVLVVLLLSCCCCCAPCIRSKRGVAAPPAAAAQPSVIVVSGPIQHPAAQASTGPQPKF